MEDKKHLQKTLTPIILEKGMPGYETVQDIEEKLNDPEVFNIAITGPYGSGKSTVLKSLKAQFPDSHKYLTISLASLTGNKDDEEKDLDEKEQQKIEYSLLQQLIYKEKPETLPKSRFRRIRCARGQVPLTHERNVTKNKCINGTWINSLHNNGTPIWRRSGRKTRNQR